MKEDKDLLPFKRPRKKILDDDDIPLGRGKAIAKSNTNNKTKRSTTKKVVQKQGPKRHTFFVENELLEKLKDLVFTRKYTKGEIEVNQSTIVHEALTKFIEEYDGEIKPRPQYIRDIENKKAKRPNAKK